MLEVTEQRPINNEYANSRISKLSPVTLIQGISNLIVSIGQLSLSVHYAINRG